MITPNGYRYSPQEIVRMRLNYFKHHDFPVKFNETDDRNACALGNKCLVSKSGGELERRDANLFITGPWRIVGVAMGRANHLSFPEEKKVRVINDARLRAIYYPDAGLKMEHVTFLDQMIQDPLLIIRLGHYAQRNSAVADILYEGLRERESKNLPTWLTTEPLMPWGAQHRSYSPLLDEYLRSVGYEFHHVELTPNK